MILEGLALSWEGDKKDGRSGCHPGRHALSLSAEDPVPQNHSQNGPRQNAGWNERAELTSRGDSAGLNRLRSSAHFLGLLFESQILIQGCDVPMQL